MTLQNEQKILRTTTVIAVMTMFMIGTISPIMTHAYAVNNQTLSEDYASDMIKKNYPAELSKIQLEDIKNIALADLKVQQTINGKPFTFMSQGFLGNIKETPIVWHPTININVNNETNVVVVVDTTNKSTLSMQATNLHKSGTLPKAAVTHAAFASDYYTGSATVSGIGATLTAPTYISTPNVLFLVNGLESAANDASACNSAFKFNNYFGQAGFYFAARSVAYTDTSFNCIVQNTGMTYAPGDPYFFQVYSTSGFKWNIVSSDLSSGQSFVYTTTFTTFANTLQTSNINTSTWVENQDTTTTWASKFTPSSLTATTGKYRDSTTGTWTNWNLDSQVVKDCSGNTQTQNVMNNNLRNGNTQTWNLVNFQVWHC